jgi:hypothetical protein
MLTWIPWMWDWPEPIAPDLPVVIPPAPPPVSHPYGYIDRVALGLARVAQQYTESWNFLAFLAALLALEQDTEDTLQTMKLQTAIDTAEGVNLYTIASVVGAPIVYTAQQLSTFIGFSDQDQAFPFWDLHDEGIQGGFWREQGEVEIGYADLWAAQRLVIRCTILRNHSNGSGDSIQRGLMFLFPNVPCIVYDHKNMSFSLGIGRYLSPIEEMLLNPAYEDFADLLPRPIGVELAQLVAFDFPYFGFADQEGAETFDVGMWANLEWWPEEGPPTTQPTPTAILPKITLIPTRR